MLRSVPKKVVQLLLGLLIWMVGGAAMAADLQTSQYTATPDPVAAGAVATFSVTVANNSVASVPNPVVTIAVSNRFQVTNAPGNFPSYCVLSGAVGSQVLTCSLPPLLGGGIANAQTFTYKATAINPGATSTSASITAAGNSDSNPGNNSLSFSPTVRAGADLTVVKAGSAPSVIAGGNLSYTLTATNNGPNTTAGVRVVDTLPALSDYQYLSASGTNWSCSLSGTTVTCNYTGAAPAVGAAYPVITIAGKITKNTAGTISNIADASITDPLVLDPNPLNDTSNTVVTNVRAGSDLQAIKGMPATITVGSNAIITLSIQNTGPQNVPAGATITDTIHSSLTIGALPPGCARSGQTVTCTAGAMSSPQLVNFNIPVTGASATPGTLSNTATVAVPAGFADPDLSNNSASVPFSVVQPDAQLELYSKAKSPSPVAPGQNITNSIVVRNLGPSVASYAPGTPIRVTDTLSADETFVSVSGNWSCSVAGNVVSCQTTNTGTLAVGDTITLPLITKAGPGVDTTVTNTACTNRTANSGHTPSSSSSPTGGDCRSAGVRSTTSVADLSIVKDMSLSPAGGWTKNLTVADTNNSFYIRLRVSNAAGSNLARTVSVTDVLPNFITSGSYITAVTQQSATSGSMSYDQWSGTASWSFTNLAAGASETLIIKVDRPFESGSFTNFASVFSPDTTESNTANNTDSAQFTTAPVADMTINSKTVTPDPARVGVPATYIISARNDGANPADNVQVIDVIDPARFEITGTPTTTKPGATCSTVVGTGTVTCNMGQFLRTEVFQINVTVLPKYPFGTSEMASLPATHTNRATVTTSTRDSNGGSNPVAGNNFIDLSHSMQAPSFDLGVTKAESDPANDDPIRFGETLNYDIRASNYGPSRATNVVVTDIPAPPPGMTMSLASVTINPVGANGGLSLQAAPNAGCSAAGATFVCKIDTTSASANYLDSGKQVVFRLVFNIGGPAPSIATTFADTAQITSAEHPVWNGTGADLQTGNNEATQNTTVRPSTDLEVVSKIRTGALQRSVNEPVEFAIRFRNNGPSSAVKVRITDTLPAGFVYVATPAPTATIPGGSSATVSAINCSGTTTITCDVDGSFPAGAANTVDLKVNAKAQAPYSGALTPTDSTDTASITPGLDSGGDPLSEDGVSTNNSQSAVVQIRPSSIAGTVYADNNNNNGIDGGEGIAGVTVTLSGTDAFGNPINATAITNASGGYDFGVLPPSGPAGYTIVETQPAAYYDLNETAGTSAGTVNNAAYGNTAAENTIGGIVLAASTDATGYIFQDHAKAVIVASNDNPPSVNGGTGQTNLTNAFTNDTFNNNPINPALINTTILPPASNPGVTMDPATGFVSVAPGTPAGTYTIDYQICDKADPANCATARVTVIVTAPPIVAVDDSVAGINGATGATNVLTALTGDTLNGVAATTSTVTITVATGSTVPSVLTFDPATGLTSVKPETPVGSYSFDYTICEILNPANCATATETVTVVAAPIVAVNDSATGINGASGAANVLNVLTGDTRNGSPATTGNVTISVAPGSSVPAGLTFDTATGNVSVVPGTPAGVYVFNYRICEVLNPANCAIAEARVTVVAAPIVAVNDSIAGINGATGAANVLTALTDDTLNGATATLATVNLSLAPGATVPAGLTFNAATGQTSVAPGTPAGVYSFDYRICEKLNPANCAIATETVTVVPAPITAADNSVAGINGASGAANVLTVLPGDTLNGVPATLATVNIGLAPGATVPTGLTFDTATGEISVVPGTPAGTYSFDYQICEKLNPTNCATATATVTVIAAPMAAVNDSVAGINGFAGASNVLNVLGGDTLNGVPATAATVNISVATGSSVPAGLSFDPATGNISVNPGTAAGTYSFDYTICEKLNPTNCRTATATVTVVAAPITADNDASAPINGATGGTAVVDAIPGDTLNGVQVPLASVTMTVVTPASPIGGAPVPVLNTTTGLVDVPPGTPAGNYQIAYRICENLNPTNCANATITVPVIAAPIAAVNDSATGINGASGAANVLNVLGADTLNGVPATLASVTITVASGATVPAGLTFDPATGNVSVNPGTPAGTYSFDYTICEKLNPTNCATATATVTVVPAPIVAKNDNVGGINGASGANNVLNALADDTLNGVPATLATVTITLAPGATVPAGLTFDPATGNTSVNPATPAGVYTFDYRICEKLNPTNCAIATETVTVIAAQIVAVNDSVSGINGASGAANVLSALTGDTLNGAPATTANVTITLAPGATVPAGLTFNPATGSTSVNPGTPAGTYSFDYRICENLNPTSCTNATETVTVIAAPIAAVNDSATGINGASGAANVLNVLTSDTLNGVPATLASVNITLASGATVPAGLTFDPATGNVSVNPGTPAGTYSFDYTICEKLNPTNCATATATVTVIAAPIAAVSESVGGINGASGANNVLNALTGDTLNGVPATTGTVNITLAPGATVPAGLTFDTATGNVSVNPATPAGVYTFDYRICERLNPTNCAIATETVTVIAAPIVAVNDNATGINGASGAPNVLNVLTADTLNGVAATTGSVTITLAPGATVPAGLAFDPATGSTSVNPGTPAGTYSFDYRICEALNPTNCATATATVTVVAAPITAANDSVGGINGASGAANVLNVLGADTLNGVPATLASVNITLASGSTVPAGLTFDPATGNVSVNPGTPAGTYSFDYTICEKLNPTNCATATATVTVVPAPIVAKNDNVGGINGASGANNVLNALADDTLNGVPATLATVTITLAPGATVPAGLSFDPATGNTSVNPATPAGVYTFDYRICENLNPTSCTNATETVTVIAAPIVATPDTTTPINGGTGAPAVITVLPNDTLNGNPATPATVTITVVTPATPINAGPVPVLNPTTGVVDVPANTPAGTYTINYQICENLNPTNCATTSITVPVTAGPIAATNDSASGINGATGAPNVLNVLTGDTRNGAPATTSNVTITVAPGSTVPAGLSFDPATGNVSVNPGTPASTYSFDYRICEALNPTNCATATATVTVVAAPIVAVNDSATGVDSATGAANVLNLFAGDTLNGQPATPANATVTLAPGATLPAGITLDLATGNASVAPNTPSGTYNVDYQLCERLNPTNCATATMTITVAASRSALTGTVYFDGNMNRSLDNGERRLQGWIVEVVRNGQVVGSVRTDANGFYSVPNLLSGNGYSVLFRHGGSNVVYGRINNANLPVNGTLANQDLPVDPSGVVYDAITRAPVAGAVVRLVDINGTPIAPSCFIDPSQASQVTSADGSYQFDIVPGANAQCPASRTEYRLQVTAPTGYANPVSSVLDVTPGSFNPAGRGNPAPVVPNARAPQAGQPTTYYLSFLLASGDGNVVNNHIPLDPFLTRTPLLITKTSDKRTANVGDLVPYTITVRNTEAAQRAAVSVVDILPPGLKYVPGTARANNVAAEPVTNDRELRWNNQTLAGNSTTTYQIVTVIGAGVTQGDRVNTALARNGNTGNEISNRGEAVVSIVPSAIFDCAEIIGKVFDDLDGDGYQDEGEPGIPAARVATVNGQLVTTDEYGRYHITCAAVPNGQIGSNFVLKLDTRTIPEGYAPTSDNPQSIRLTRGKISELNFGVQKARVVAIAIDARAFEAGSGKLLPNFAQRLAALKTVKAQRLVIQVTYTASRGDDAKLIAVRLTSVRESIAEAFKTDWEGPPPVIETDTISASGRE